MKSNETKKTQERPKLQQLRKGWKLEELEDHELESVVGAGGSCGGADTMVARR